jgi:hypothetical protein
MVYIGCMEVYTVYMMSFQKSGLKIFCIDIVEEMPLARRSIPFVPTSILIAEDNLTFEKVLDNHYTTLEEIDPKIRKRRKNTYQNHMGLLQRELERRSEELKEPIREFKQRWYVGEDYIKAVQEADKRSLIKSHPRLIKIMQDKMSAWGE